MNCFESSADEEMEEWGDCAMMSCLHALEEERTASLETAANMSRIRELENELNTSPEQAEADFVDGETLMTALRNARKTAERVGRIILECGMCDKSVPCARILIDGDDPANYAGAVINIELVSGSPIGTD